VRKRWLIERLGRSQQVGAAGMGTGKTAPLDPAATWYGAVWAINTRLLDYPVRAVEGYSEQVRQLFAAVRTDLNTFTTEEMNSLENHGYALADAAVRSYAPKLCHEPGTVFSWPHQTLATDAAVEAALRHSAQRHLGRDIWQWFKGLWR